MYYTIETLPSVEFVLLPEMKRNDQNSKFLKLSSMIYHNKQHQLESHPKLFAIAASASLTSSNWVTEQYNKSLSSLSPSSNTKNDVMRVVSKSARAGSSDNTPETIRIWTIPS